MNPFLLIILLIIIAIALFITFYGGYLAALVETGDYKR